MANLAHVASLAYLAHLANLQGRGEFDVRRDRSRVAGMPAASEVDVAELLRQALRRDAARPLVTYYDDATGERTELSVATAANWVAKAGNLLVTDLELEDGDALGIALPPHWQACVWLLAAWSCGVTVVDLREDGSGDPRTPSGEPAAVVVGPPAVHSAATGHDTGSAVGAVSAPSWQVLVTALAPLNAPAPEPLLEGGHDADRALLAQPDIAPVVATPDPMAAALVRDGSSLSLRDVRAAGVVPAGARLLTDRSPLDPAVAAHLLGALSSGGSLVLCRHLDAAVVERRIASEQVDEVLL